MKNKILSALLLSTALALSAPAHATSTGVWAGGDFSNNVWYTYAGGVTALSHQDLLTQDGFLARIDGGYGQYEYNTNAVVGKHVDGDVGSIDAMVGYRAVVPNGMATGYLGADWQDHNLSPTDPLNRTDGSRGGVKGALDLNFKPADKIGVNFGGSLSSAFTTYWTHADVNYNFGGFSVGPEAGAFGNRDFHATRYGARVGDIDLGFADVSLHGGWENKSEHGDDGGYGAIGFSRNF